MLIEKAFGLLKCRFDMKDIDLASRMIIAACILHNLCNDYDDETELDS